MIGNEELLRRLDDIARMQRNDATTACKDAAAAIKSLENDLAIANFAWKSEKEHSKQVGREIEALQAKIDRLMLEYCPDEMTPRQRENWANHQKAALQEVDTALGGKGVE